MKKWEKALRKIKFLGFLMLLAASLGAAVYGIATDVAVAAPNKEETTPAPEMVLTKEVKASGEIIFRLEPVNGHEYPLATDEPGDKPEDEADETPNPAKTEKRFLVCWDEGLSAEPVRGISQEEPFVQEPQPTVFVQATSTKKVEKYAGRIDYDAILQGPIIYDFGPEGIHALECVVWHEARGEPFDGQVAVAASAINRLYSNCPWFDDKSSIIGVLSEPYQFAYLEVSDADLATCPNVSRAVQAAIRGADPTVCEAFPDGAMWYYNPDELDDPTKFSEVVYELRIGHHNFHNYDYKWKQ